MIEKIGHIKNPLTVIAIFAGIAEISGTAVLPFISSDNQATYIWFLMLFPFFLVAVFFTTLNLNREALYSPSDYRDENNFVKSIRKATSEELRQKLQQEVIEAQADVETLPTTTPDEDLPQENTKRNQEAIVDQAPDNTLNIERNAQGSRNHGTSADRWGYDNKARFISDLSLAEKLAVARLSKSLGFKLEKHVSLPGAGGRSITFDGFGIHANTAHAAEVKLLASKIIDPSRFYSGMVSAAYASQRLKEEKVESFIYHIFIVAELTPAQRSRLRVELRSFAATIGLEIEIHVTPFTSLIEAAENEQSLST